MIVTGLFMDTKAAGEAVAALKQKTYTKYISLVSRDREKGDVDAHSVKTAGEQGATAGAAIGVVAGGAAIFLAGISAVAIPGVGIVAGSIATALAAAATGGVTGGLIGYLVDKGIPDDTAKKYQERIMEGEVLIAVEVDKNNISDVETVLEEYGAVQIESGRKG